MSKVVLQAGEVESYTGIGGYTKQRATVFYMDAEGNKKVIDTAKAEPVVDAEGKLVSWVRYARYGRRQTKTPKFAHTLSVLIGRMQAQWDALHRPAQGYENSEEAVDCSPE